MRISEPPTGLARVKWLGPGFLWMVSAAGSGELLFTPRIGALYGYSLLWALLAAVALKWFINREIGRFTVCTGRTILSGFARLPGPRGWAVWLIVLPQLVVAVATIAGLAGAAATALASLLPGDVRWWMLGSLASATALIYWGRYRMTEIVASVIAVALGVACIIAAVAVGPPISEMTGGLMPRVPKETDLGEVLPWLGFAMAGAAGMIWYSYWVSAKGYGVAARDSATALSLAEPGEAESRRLRGWLAQMTLDNTVAVVGTLVVMLAFLVLGTELLGPRGLVPEEDRIAEVLGRLLGDVWGPVGFYFMVVAVFVGFWDTVLTDQDGFARMFADGTRLVAPGRASGTRWSGLSDAGLRRVFLVTLLAVIPLVLYLVAGEPVQLLKVAGAIEATHIPLVTALTLWAGHREIAPALRPSKWTLAMTALAAVFFAVFAVAFIRQLVTAEG